MDELRTTWMTAALITALAIPGCFRSNPPEGDAPDENANASGMMDSATKSHSSKSLNAQEDDNKVGNEEPDQPPAGETSNPTAPEVRQRCLAGSADPIKKLDLLFMVDNSGSMKEEQAALREQFPSMITKLIDAGVNDLHLGVVSSDMGLIGISDIKDCEGLGDDGIMQNEPRIQSCQPSYPRFLSYEGNESSAQLAQDFSCIAMLGTDGCGFEQQLESGLKALWPATDSRITFLGDVNGFGTHGHGDNENQGFLRNDPETGLSAIAIVLVTDEEDCSSKNTVHFTPATYLDPNNSEDAKLLGEGLNVRCFGNPENLYEVQRYINGYKALRPGNEDLVMFGAIVGVPPSTVDADTLASTDFDDAASRGEFYDHILDDELMQNVVDDQGTPDPADDTMKPSCNTATGLAYPPRRIVKVAEGFGPNGMVQSICQQDFGPAVTAIASRIGAQLASSGCP